MSRGEWNWRRLLAVACFAAGAMMAFGSMADIRDHESPATSETDFSWINQVEGPRPEFVWENREDVFYHDLSFPDGKITTAPEFVAFMGRAWVFNRAMEWRREDGCILCYSVGGDLPLTGANAVSAWHSDPTNLIEQAGEFTRFEKRSTVRRRDCIVLPAFQFHVGQHPKLELTVSDATGEWQFVVAIKGRAGAPLVSSRWQRGEGNFTFDLAEALRTRGYELNYPEVHFVLGVWAKDAESPSSVRFRVRLLGQPALVACLPVIRTATRASSAGVPIVAAALDKKGQRLKADRVKVFALVDGRRIPLGEQNGLWKASLRGLPTGNHKIELAAEGAIEKTAIAHVRVTDGRFWRYDRDHLSLTRDGKLTGPRSGSYQGIFFFKDAGLPDEKLVNGQKEWDSWDRSKAPGERMHYWEGLTEKELDGRFAYLAKSGFDHLHVAQHWGVWERLDAGGRIAPHAAEQLALYLRVADRHGLSLMQALTHYEYCTQSRGWHGTVPYTRYLGAGFEDKDWYEPGRNNRFEEMFHQYLLDFVTLFGEETALFAMTASGEGDAYNGLPRSDDVFRFIREHDKNHLFLAEPVHLLRKLPDEYVQDWEQDMLSGRTYWIGKELLPEFDLGVEFKLYQLGGLYMAEGSWAASNLYARFHHEVLGESGWVSGSWVGTDFYRTRLRDSLYLGLVHRLPLMMTWDEQVSEDEHRIVAEIREKVDWGQRFMRPKVAIRVDNSSVIKEGRAKLAEYEKAFAALPLAYFLIRADAAVPDGVTAVIDAREPFQKPAFHSKGGALPDELRESMPLLISNGYCSDYSWSGDRRTLLAYVYNVTNHEEVSFPLGGRFHRVPKPADLQIHLQNQPNTKLKYALYDLCEKRVIQEGLVEGELDLKVGKTDKDYFVLVTPPRVGLHFSGWMDESNAREALAGGGALAVGGSSWATR